MRHLSIVLTHRPRLRSKRLAWFVSAALAGGTVNAPVAAQSFPPVVNLGGLSTSDGSVFGGAAPSDYAGYSVSAVGDINGDGLADLVIGASQADPDATTNAGTTYVIFGSQTGPAGRNLESVNGSDGFALTGVGTSDFSGSSIAGAGDFNGDGIDDLIVGASQADNSGPDSGSAYIVFGRSDGFPATLDLGSLDGTNGFRLDGEAAGDRFGVAVDGADDVNGDGFDDVIIGAHVAAPEGQDRAGASYVIFGSADASASASVADLNGNRGFRIIGAAPGDLSGRAVAGAGDFNGDGFNDLIIGALGAEPTGSYSGSAFVVLGRSQFPASIDLAAADGANSFRLDGEASGNFAGRSVASAGDVNDDGFDDVIIGAPLAGPSQAGRAYLVFGSGGPFAAVRQLAGLNGTTGSTLNGAVSREFAGFAVNGGGDVNGDGIDDLVVGAYAASTNGASSGSAYVVFGRGAGFPNNINLADLDGLTGFRLNGASANDLAGRAVDIVGDPNADGISDLIIAAPNATVGENAQAGVAYLIFGREPGAPGEPAIAIAPAQVDFGAVRVGQVSANETLTIENTGSADLNLGTISINGVNAEDFGLAEDACSNQILAPAASCLVGLTLTPSAPGARQAQVDVPSNAAAEPTPIPITGEGVQPEIMVLPNTINFSDIPVGQTSAAQTVTIENTGSGDLSLQALGITGSHAGDFSITDDTCSNQILVPSGSCTAGIVFTPTDDGAREASLEIQSDAASGPDRIDLNGNRELIFRDGFESD